MRNLSVVASLLGISVACSNKPAPIAPPAAGTESKPAASVPLARRLPPHRTRTRIHLGRPRQLQACGEQPLRSDYGEGIGATTH
jgi:hypothetical protein